MKKPIKEVVMAFTQEHWDAILKYADDNGIPNTISTYQWRVYNENACLNFNEGNRISYGDYDFYMSEGATILTFQEFADEYLYSLKQYMQDAVVAAGNLEDAVNRGLEAAKEKLEQDASSAESTNNTSDTNPKRQFGLASIPLHLWSPLASAYGSLGLYNGSLKYGRNNFKATPVEASIYIAAAKRHLEAWSEGEEYDPADGVPNLGGVLANIAILLEARAAGTLVDDRQMGTGYLKEREHLKEIMKNVTEIHKDKNPRHYTIADNPKEAYND